MNNEHSCVNMVLVVEASENANRAEPRVDLLLTSEEKNECCNVVCRSKTRLVDEDGLNICGEATRLYHVIYHPTSVWPPVRFGTDAR